jgi:5-methylcytosine-specific restriction endonuclease McrA
LATNSRQWRCRRDEVIVRQRFRCGRCGQERHLQVHHLSYDHLGDERPDELVALCLMCHWTVHNDEQEARRLFRPCGVR